MQLHRDLVAHRSRRHEQRCFLPELLGAQLFVTVDSRIFAGDIVAALSISPGVAYFGRGSRHGTATEVEPPNALSPPLLHSDTRRRFRGASPNGPSRPPGRPLLGPFRTARAGQGAGCGPGGPPHK